MSYITIPAGAMLSGTIQAISSKSDVHRLLICASLCPEPVKIKCFCADSKDILATSECLSALGAKIEFSDTEIRVIKPIDMVNVPKNARLFCNESGSTARFLLPLASYICAGATLDGAGKLPERPFDDLCRCLEAMGAVFDSHSLPITVKKCAAPSGYFEISGNVSSQYLTGLLFLLPLCNAKGIKLTTALESAGYVRLTADAMRHFGVEITRNGDIFSAFGKYTAPESGIVKAEGDWSNAAFWLCSPENGNSVTVTGLDINSSQPDKGVCRILSGMGFEVISAGDAVTSKAPAKVRAVNFDAREIPDIVPILALRAAAADGVTVITGVKRLRIKESDRVKSVCEMIEALGGKANSDEDSMTIYGSGTLSGGTVDSFNDHRIAMSAAIGAAFCTGDVKINSYKAVEKSYPMFFEHYKMLSGINELNCEN